MSKNINLPEEIQEMLRPQRTLGIRIKEKVVNWLLRGVHVHELTVGKNSISMSPGGTDVVQWSASQVTSAGGDIGMNVTTGEPKWYDVAGTADKSMVDHGDELGLADDDHTQYILVAGTRAFTGNQSAGSNKITALASATANNDAVGWNQSGIQLTGLDANSNKITSVATCTASDDAANKAYVDNVVSGIQWLEPVDVGATSGYIGTRTILEIDALTPGTGDAVVAGTAGTPSAPTSDLLAIGDIAEFDGTGWQKIIANSGGFPPDGTRGVVSTTATLYSPMTDGTDDGKIGTWDGTSLTPGLYTPSDGDALLCNADNAVDENKQFVFDGAVPTGTWIQFGGTGTNHGSLSGLGNDDHTQYLLLAGRAGGQSAKGGTAASENLTLESTAHATKGNVVVASGSNVQMAGDDDFVPATTNEGELGTDALKFKRVRATTVVSGDHDFIDEEKDAHWTFTEERDHMVAINRKTNERFKLSMELLAS